MSPSDRDDRDETVPSVAVLGLTGDGDDDPGRRLVVRDDARAAVEGAHFVQESLPERLAFKHARYAADRAAGRLAGPPAAGPRVERARALYTSVGKVTIAIRREVPGRSGARPSPS